MNVARATRTRLVVVVSVVVLLSPTLAGCDSSSGEPETPGPSRLVDENEPGENEPGENEPGENERERGENENERGENANEQDES